MCEEQNLQREKTKPLWYMGNRSSTPEQAEGGANWPNGSENPPRAHGCHHQNFPRWRDPGREAARGAKGPGPLSRVLKCWALKPSSSSRLPVLADKMALDFTHVSCPPLSTPKTKCPQHALCLSQCPCAEPDSDRASPS